MSSTEFMMVKLRLVEPRENETMEELRLRLWLEAGNEIEYLYEDELTPSDDIGFLNLACYIEVKGKMYEIFDDVSSENSDSCEITKNEDGTLSFTAVYYTGCTCAQEQVALTLADMID